MAKYTKAQTKRFYKDLRERWAQAKEVAKKNEVQAAFIEAGVQGVSVASWVYVKSQLIAQKKEGTPYVDTKTYKGWVESGFRVRKGEKSSIHGICFTEIPNKTDPKSSFSLPTSYALFHRDQVEPIVEILS